MAQNGAAALHLIGEPPTTKIAADRPDVAPTKVGVEVLIGQAVAAATATLAAGIMTFHHHGMLDPAVKAAGGTQIAKVAELALAHELGDHDFNRVAREQGKAVLRQYLDASFFQHFSAEQGDAAIDMYIGGLLEIVAHVIKDERALRAAWAN